MPTNATNELRDITLNLNRLLDNIQSETPTATADIKALRDVLAGISASQFVTNTESVVKSLTNISAATTTTGKDIQTLVTGFQTLIQTYEKFSDVVRASKFEQVGALPAGTKEGVQRMRTSQLSLVNTNLANQFDASINPLTARLGSAGNYVPYLGGGYDFRYRRSPGNQRDVFEEFLGMLDPVTRKSISDVYGPTRGLYSYVSQMELSGNYANRLTTAQSFAQNYGEGAYGRLEDFLGTRNLTPNILNDPRTRISTELSTGISTISVTRESEQFAGQVERMSFTVDKFGNVLGDTQKRFRTFGDAIRRDTLEFLKWTIAATVILGPLRKLQELVDAMIQSQSQLADIQIATGQSTTEVFKAFQAAAQIATETGSDLRGTLETYVLSYRAAGDAASETQRAADANILLRDSLILSKLAGIEQAQAVDILSGGLKQLGKDFGYGQQLIASWLAVTKTANVSMETLAQSFAITASAAENVGLPIDQLNGVIAATAEVTNLSATETGNMVRAIISGYQTDQASNELSKYGIAVKDSTGEMRDFLDVFQEVKARADAGLISDKQLSSIAETLGGGARRGAQVAAFIKNLGRVDQVARASALGDVADLADALAIKLDTVDTASQNLANAFITLAQTAGTRGGILGIMTDVLNLTTFMVTKFGALTNALGTVTPALIAYAAANELVLKNDIRRAALLGGRYGQILGGLGRVAGNTAAYIGNRLPGAIPEQTFRRAEGVRESISNIQPEAVLAGGYVAYGIISALREGNPGQAIGNAVGGAVGAFLGGPTGAVIGSTIGGAFINTVNEWATTDFATLIQQAFDEAAKEAEGGGQITEVEAAQKRLDAAAKDLEVATGNRITALITNATDALLGEGTTAKKFGYENADQFFLEQAKLQYPELYATLEAAQKSLEEAQARSRIAQGQDLAPIYEQLKATSVGQIEPFTARFAPARGEEAFKQFFQGELSDPQYRRTNEALQTLDSNLAAIYTKFQDKSIADFWTELTGNINDTDKAMTDFSEVFLRLTDEQRLKLIEFINAYAQVAQKVEVGLAPQEQLTQAGQDAAKYLEYARAGIEDQLSSERNLSFYSIPPEYLSDLDTIIAKAEELRDLDLAAQAQELGVTVESLINEIGDLGIKTGGVLQQTADDMTSEYVGAAIEILKQLGIIDDATKALGFKQLDIASGQFGQVMQRYKYYENILGAEGYKPQLEEQILLFSDDQTQKIRLDLNLLELALQDLIDVNKKQLDGIYNLPTDATFFVPLAAAEMDRSTREQLAAGEIDTSSLDNSAGNLDQSAGALNQSAVALISAATYLAQIRAPENQKFYAENPEARTRPPVDTNQYSLGPYQTPEDIMVNPLSYLQSLGPFQTRADISPVTPVISNVPIQTSITLEAQQNVTLMIDRQIIGAIVAAEVGKTIAQTHGMGGSNTRRQVM